MNQRVCYFVCFALSFLLLSPLHAQQSPDQPPPPLSIPAASAATAGVIASAQANQRAGCFTEADASLQAALRQAPLPVEPSADRQALQLAVADMQYAWAENLRKEGEGPMQTLPHDQAALDAALVVDRTLRPAQAANDLLRAGIVFAGFEETGKAFDFYQQAIILYGHVSDKDGQAKALEYTGILWMKGYDYHKAVQSFARCMALFRQVHDKSGEANALAGLGSVCYFRNQAEKSLGYYQKARPLFQQAGNKDGEACALAGIGCAYGLLNQSSISNDFFQKALVLFEQVNDAEGKANALENLDIDRQNRLRAEQQNHAAQNFTYDGMQNR